MIDLKKIMQAFGFASAMFATGLVAEASSIDEQADYHFNVYLNGKEIGTHKVQLKMQDGIKKVNIEADFDVKVLFVSVYKYRHTNQETWEGQCLNKVDASTDANGEKFFISSKQAEQGMQLFTHEGERGVDGCVRSFAYWDLDLLQADMLLNTQTGEYVRAELDEKGIDNIQLGDVSTPSKKYQLVTEDGTIDLWYTLDDRWVALESKTSNGMTLRYEAKPEADYATASL